MLVIVHSVPPLPDGSIALLAGSDAPWDYLADGVRTLEKSVAALIVIACNTAHVWHARLAEQAAVPGVHIGHVTRDAILRGDAAPRRVSILATSATLRARIYHDDLEVRGIDVIEPDDDTQQRIVMPGIQAVKAGRIAEGRELLEEAAPRLIRVGAEVVLMACTELPVALDGSALGAHLVDPTTLLADACAAWWQRSRPLDTSRMTEFP